MAQWMVSAPDTETLTRLLACYGCTLSLSGNVYTVTHGSGRTATALDSAGAIRAAIKLDNGR